MQSSKCTFLSLVGLGILSSACNSSLGPQDFGFNPGTTWNSTEEAPVDTPLIVDENAQVEQAWWRNFDDPILDVLIAEALENNKTLAIATARIEEAWAAHIASSSILFPQVDLLADASRGNQGFFTNGTTLSTEDLNIQATWEIDLFGKNQARLRADNALVQSAQAMRQAVLVTLLADVARNYFDMRNYEKQIAIIEENLASQKRTLKLTQEQLEGGLASDFDVQRAGAQVSTTESLLPTLQIAYIGTRNRLNILLGVVPGEKDCLLMIPQHLQPLNQQIIVSAPATVIATRPDVRDAERRFAASISRHEAAVRELFPTISLLSFFGMQGTSLFNTIPTWNIVGNLSQPLINFGQIKADIIATDSRRLQAYLDYQQTVLLALEEMENALANYLLETVRNASLAQAAEQNRKAMDLTNQQYTNGYTALLDVLVVQRNLLESESSQATSDIKLRKNLVEIYTAAGGGWAIDP